MKLCRLSMAVFPVYSGEIDDGIIFRNVGRQIHQILCYLLRTVQLQSREHLRT
jgi:hypothetical protein